MSCEAKLKTLKSSLRNLRKKICRTGGPFRKHIVIRRTCRARLTFKGSLTVEAALAIPLFVMAACILMYPLKILSYEMTLFEKAEARTELLSSQGYLLESAEERFATERFAGEIELPFTKVFGIDAGTYLITSRKRLWTGREGGYGKEWAEEAESCADEDSRTVYIAKNSSVSGKYHLSESCHYISNTVTAVAAGDVMNYRNSGGGKYHPCPSCRPGTSGTVYIFKSGDSYHSTTSCKAIGSYVEMITEKEAKERGYSVCSYCRTAY